MKHIKTCSWCNRDAIVHVHLWQLCARHCIQHRTAHGCA